VTPTLAVCRVALEMAGAPDCGAVDAVTASDPLPEEAAGTASDPLYPPTDGIGALVAVAPTAIVAVATDTLVGEGAFDGCGVDVAMVTGDEPPPPHAARALATKRKLQTSNGCDRPSIKIKLSLQRK